LLGNLQRILGPYFHHPEVLPIDKAGVRANRSRMRGNTLIDYANGHYNGSSHGRRSQKGVYRSERCVSTMWLCTAGVAESPLESQPGKYGVLTVVEISLGLLGPVGWCACNTTHNSPPGAGKCPHRCLRFSRNAAPGPVVGGDIKTSHREATQPANLHVRQEVIYKWPGVVDQGGGKGRVCHCARQAKGEGGEGTCP